MATRKLKRQPNVAPDQPGEAATEGTPLASPPEDSPVKPLVKSMVATSKAAPVVTPLVAPPANRKFPREARLVRRSEFDAVYRAGKRRSSSHFTIFVRPNALPLTRFGFSIKKALGNAVTRNRIRRRLREMVRIHRQEIPAGWDVVMHPKSSVGKLPLAALTQDLLRLVKAL
jgi:ribonuclease P protein component